MKGRLPFCHPSRNCRATEASQDQGFGVESLLHTALEHNMVCWDFIQTWGLIGRLVGAVFRTKRMTALRFPKALETYVIGHAGLSYLAHVPPKAGGREIDRKGGGKFKQLRKDRFSVAFYQTMISLENLAFLKLKDIDWSFIPIHYTVPMRCFSSRAGSARSYAAWFDTWPGNQGK